MSRASRIVRVTFWMNNVVMATLGVLILGRGTGTQMMGSLVAAGGLFLVFMYLWWVLRVRLHVTSMRGMWYVDDERERTIARKVMTGCLAGLSNGLWGILVMGTALWLGQADSHLTVVLLLGTLYGLWLVINLMYYGLWTYYIRA